MIKGITIDDFTYLEVDEGNFDLNVVSSMLNKGHHNGVSLYIVRGHLKSNIYKKLADHFSTLIDERSSSRKSTEVVNVDQIGATQFLKSGKDYIKSVVNNRPLVNELFRCISSNEHKNMFFDDALAEISSNFRAASFMGEDACAATTRVWKNQSEYSLAAHEDSSQLEYARSDGFEIFSVQQVIFKARKDNDYLVLWNVIPDQESKVRLGVEKSGIPYPIEVLNAFEKIEVNLREGDLYFMNANLVHAVRTKDIEYKRISSGRFLGVSSDGIMLYWT